MSATEDLRTQEGMLAFMARLRREARADVAETDIDNHLTKTPHGISHHSRLVINCPNCGERMMLCQVDSEIYDNEEIENECGHCSAQVHAAMKWEAAPVLVELDAKVLSVPAAEEEL